MSAITGIFYRDGRNVDLKLIKKMNNKLSHRGPDGSAVWCEGPVALGNQMLWTTPESLHEKLPFEDEESGLVIIADARIDNRNELSKELDIYNNEEVSDSYFILKAYSKWGENCPEHLLGDFAFAIWDKDDEKLFCARDHMGVKPFYYYLSDEIFVFATEIKAILTIPEIPNKLNELKLAFFLQVESTDKLFTFYEGILRLIPAHSLSLNQKNTEMKKYWELDPESKIIMDSEEDYINAFREIFAEAIRCRLRSAFPVGFDLSGGLDSSSLVCMAKKILNENNDIYSDDLNTFSYVFEELKEIDERFYIEKVVDTGGIKSHYIFGDRISPLEQVNTSLSYQDQPYSNPFLPIIRNSYKKMHECGVRTFLCGAGGDYVIYTGKNYFFELAVTFQWYRLIREISASSKLMKNSVYKKFINDIFYPLIPDKLKVKLKKVFCHYTLKISCPFNYLNENFAKKLKINGNEYSKDYQKLIKMNTAKKYHYYSLTGDMAQNHFETLDLTSESFSVDPRYPYYDKRLVEFCYSIPTSMKFKVWNRYIQRVSMEGILPPEVQWRTNKATFCSFLTRNLLLFEKQHLDMMVNNNGIIKDYVDFEKLRDVYKKYKLNKGISYADTYFLWITLILFLWLMRYPKRI